MDIIHYSKNEDVVEYCKGSFQLTRNKQNEEKLAIRKEKIGDKFTNYENNIFNNKRKLGIPIIF